jgi:hypothetical protein
MTSKRHDARAAGREWLRTRRRPGAAIGLTLRAGAAVLCLLLVGVLNQPRVDAGASAADASIDAPADEAQVDGVVELRGRATVSDGRRFAFYRLLIGIGRSPASMRPLGPPYDRPVENGLLATWNTDRFPPGEYLITLQVYADDEEYASASVLLAVKDKPTPTPMPLALPSPIDDPSPVAAPGPRPAPPVPAEGQPVLDVPIPPLDESDPPAPAPVPTIAVPGEVVPIQPIPFDPNDPGPFPIDTPTTWSPGQLPFDPAPVYATPVDLSPTLH